MYEIELERLAASLGAGQHTGLPCPKCAGATTDRALSMLVDPPSIKAVCHRASCGFVYRNSASRWESMGSEVRPSRARPYTDELHALDEEDYVWFLERFHLPRKVLGGYRKSMGRYFLPILGPEGTRRGWVSRRPWDGSPLYEDGPFGGFSHESHPKSLTYMDNEEPVQHWTGTALYTPLVLVEDQISALKYTWATDRPAVALLGTGVNEEKIAEIQRHAKSIVFALDSDATGQAFSNARKWGQAFESCQVRILKHDLKDTNVQTIREIFALIAPT